MGEVKSLQKKVKVSNNQEMSKSEPKSHSKTEVGKVKSGSNTQWFVILVRCLVLVVNFHITDKQINRNKVHDESKATINRRPSRSPTASMKIRPWKHRFLLVEKKNENFQNIFRLFWLKT